MASQKALHFRLCIYALCIYPWSLGKQTMTPQQCLTRKKQNLTKMQVKHMTNCNIH